ncbi:MAG: 50S ribosomal protein L2 [Candidatus Omnitrophota bacterium]
MGIKSFKPTTPSRRWMQVSTFDDITTTTPYKPLTIPLKKRGGRNSYGRITVRHQGGGHKQRIRLVDFRMDKFDIKAKVLSIEYDPNRTARIALVEYMDNEKRYILCPVGLKVGDEIITSTRADIKVGNTMQLRNIPSGTSIYNLQLFKGKKAQAVRSAGSAAQILAKEEKLAHVRMPSGEIRLVDLDCFATIGQVSNPDHIGISIGKAGRSRWLGIRPSVRGVAMNPIDHPMGGGEGKSSGGRHPCTPWGKITKGLKTRKKKKLSSKFIMKRRPPSKKRK